MHIGNVTKCIWKKPKKVRLSENEKQVYVTTKDTIICFHPSQSIVHDDVTFESTYISCIVEEAIVNKS